MLDFENESFMSKYGNAEQFRIKYRQLQIFSVKLDLVHKQLDTSVITFGDMIAGI